MSCTLRFGLGLKGGLVVIGAPRSNNMSGLNQVGHLHLSKKHVHGSKHDGIMCSSVGLFYSLFIIPSLISKAPCCWVG